MRMTSWILFLPLMIALVAGCKQGVHDQPKTKPRAQEEKVAQNNPPPQPKQEPAPKDEGFKFSKKGGGNIVSNVRGAVYRTERQSELKQIGLSFQQFCDEYKGSNRTLDNFLKYIRTYGPIHDAVKDGYYQMNMKARLTGSDIIAHERDIDRQGYLSVMGDGSVRYVPQQEFKAAMGMP